MAGHPSPPFTTTASRSPTGRPSVSPTALRSTSPGGGRAGTRGTGATVLGTGRARPGGLRGLRGTSVAGSPGPPALLIASWLGRGLYVRGVGHPTFSTPRCLYAGATSKAQAHRAGPLDEASAVTGPRSGLLCGGGDLAATNSLSRLASSWAVLGGSWGRALLSAGLACRVPFSTPLRGWLGRSPLRRRVARPRSGPSPAPKGGRLRQWRRGLVLLPADDRDGYACSALRRKQGGGGGMRTAEARVAKLAWNGDLPR